MNSRLSLTWYAKAGVETPVVTCEAHRLAEYHRRVAAGFSVAGAIRDATGVYGACECDVCRRDETVLTEAQKEAAAKLREMRPAVLDGTNIVLNDRDRADWYRNVSATMSNHGIYDDVRVAAFCDIAGVPS